MIFICTIRFFFILNSQPPAHPSGLLSCHYFLSFLSHLFSIFTRAASHLRLLPGNYLITIFTFLFLLEMFIANTLPLRFSWLVPTSTHMTRLGKGNLGFIFFQLTKKFSCQLLAASFSSILNALQNRTAVLYNQGQPSPPV